MGKYRARYGCLDTSTGWVGMGKVIRMLKPVIAALIEVMDG